MCSCLEHGAKPSAKIPQVNEAKPGQVNEPKMVNEQVNERGLRLLTCLLAVYSPFTGCPCANRVNPALVYRSFTRCLPAEASFTCGPLLKGVPSKRGPHVRRVSVRRGPVASFIENRTNLRLDELAEALAAAVPDHERQRQSVRSRRSRHRRR